MNADLFAVYRLHQDDLIHEELLGTTIAARLSRGSFCIGCHGPDGAQVRGTQESIHDYFRELI